MLSCRPFGPDNSRGFATENWKVLLRLPAPQARQFSGAQRRRLSAAQPRHFSALTERGVPRDPC